ncbi:MAG: HDIG domain-containing protein [Caldisericia bacterium]|nr:HDIG domain-containing protein [Caldisericia bacterium]
MAYILIFIVLVSYYFPDFTFVLTSGKVAPYNIISPIDDQIEDVERTTEERERAASRVSDVYNKNNLVLIDSLNKIDIVFNSTIAVIRDRSLLATKERVESLKNILVNQPNQLGFTIKDQVLEQMVELNSAEIEDLRNNVELVVTKLLNEGINEISVPEIPRKISSVIIQLGSTVEIRQLTADLSPFFIKQNMELDKVATVELKQQARNSIAPIIREVKKGEIIVKSGDIISDTDIEIFKRVGISRPVRDWKIWLGIILLPFALIVAVALIIHTSKKLHFKEHGNLVFLAVLIVFYIATSRYLVGTSVFFALITVFAFLMGMFFDNTIAVRVIFVVSPFTALFKTIGNTPASSIAIIAIGFGLIGYLTIFTMPKVKRFADFFVVGAYSITGTVFAGILYALFAEMPFVIMLNTILIAIISSLVQFFLALGLTPLLEYITSTTTVFRLLELSDLNHPALKQLIMDAPGTYQHSIFVGNMASVACEKIGANSLLARVGGYYHDLGKLKNPQIFIENQPADCENPHDKLTPSMSANMIINHTTDGIELADKYRLPYVVKEFMITHHGTSAVSYFLKKARSVDPLVDESTYRYKGIVPKTKEEAIVMMADVVESAGRAIQPELPKIEGLIDKLISERIADGQFDNSPISIAELTQVKKVFISQMASFRHKRIQYETPKDGKNGQS